MKQSELPAFTAAHEKTVEETFNGLRRTFDGVVEALAKPAGWRRDGDSVIVWRGSEDISQSTGLTTFALYPYGGHPLTKAEVADGAAEAFGMPGVGR